MIIRPVYNILLLPDVSYYFKKDFFSDWCTEPIEVGTDILFIQLKEEREEGTLAADSFYPIGVSARVEGLSEGDNIQVRTMERVDISDIEIQDGVLTATASIRPEEADLTAEEEKELFGSLRATLLKFVQGYQWGLWARSFVLQRKNIYDLACALTEYLNLSAEEKYAILAADSRKERCGLIAKAINEFVEIAKVSEEAKTAQKDNQEQLYREAALKKQIDYLQKELDDMHPENESDVRKFEKKIVIIPGLFEPPVRILRATIPENESHAFR